MPLTLGDPETRPDASLSIWVELKKAVMPASAPSMKKMSLRGFEKARTQAAAAAASQSQSQSQAFRGSKRPATEPAEGDEDEKEQLAKEALQRQLRFEEKQNRERQAQKLAGEDIEMRKVGLDFDKVLREEGLRESTAENADIASHDVMTERRFFYRPPDKPKNVEEAKAAKKKSTGDDDEEVEESVRAQQEEEEEEQRWREAIEVDLSEAYHYGGSLVPIGDLDDGAGTLAGLQTGMEIVSFMKESDVRSFSPVNPLFFRTRCSGGSGRGEEDNRVQRSCSIRSRSWSTRRGETHLVEDGDVGSVLLPHGAPRADPFRMEDGRRLLRLRDYRTSRVGEDLLGTHQRYEREEVGRRRSSRQEGIDEERQAQDA
jgi:hypothetical protein